MICREYPPAIHAPGGIGTYARHISHLLAAAGETVHVIAQKWKGAPSGREESIGGRLIVHRVALDEPVPDRWAPAGDRHTTQMPGALLSSSCPSQAFSWQAALLAERLIESDGIEVIEAQEWEAPLYYLQLRRALDLGPRRRPPCVVHLHSPSAQIFAANGWDLNVADYLPATGMENYSITSADALLCPSHFLGNQALILYAVDRSRLSVIPYPLGDVPYVRRSPAIWSAGSICHVGRLELRKGVLEWADAVAALAHEHGDGTIEFVGADTPLRAIGGPTVGDAIRARVPRDVRRRFRFHGSRDRRGVMDVLSRVCAAVVPSRWENYPYSCIEAMCSGLPVIASPNGGMRELVEDGVSGWIASDSTARGLATALRRAFETSPAERERMGIAASETVRRVCRNELIVERHLEVKRQIAHVPARRRVSVPGHLCHRSNAVRDPAASPQPVADDAPPRGIGVIVVNRSRESGLDSCLSSIRAQTAPPRAVCIVSDVFVDVGAPMDPVDGWRVVQCHGRSIDDAALAVAEQLTSSDRSVTTLTFVDSRVRLAPEFLSLGDTVFAHDDRLGIVSAWTHELEPRNQVHIQPSPGVPYIWRGEEIAPYVAVRTEAFDDALRSLRDSAQVPSRQILLETVMRSGWAAVTYPAVLGSIVLARGDPAARSGAVRYSSMAQAIQRLHTPLLRWVFTCPPDERRALVLHGIRNPARSARWLAARMIPQWR